MNINFADNKFHFGCIWLAVWHSSKVLVLISRVTLYQAWLYLDGCRRVNTLWC